MTSTQRGGTVLVVDDTLANVELLEASLTPRGFRVLIASSGPEALERMRAEAPDVVLLDVLMPGMDGIEVCRRIRADPSTSFVPVVMVTASVTQDKLRAIEAGADDFLSKPLDQAELLARISSLVRIKRYHDTIQQQALQLTEWNQTLEERVRCQVEELERLGRLRRVLSPALAELIVSAEGEALLESHRSQIAVVCCRLTGFPSLAETAAPEEIVELLREYHDAVGAIVFQHEGTTGALNADRLTVYLNDPLPVDNPGARAVRMALAMRNSLQELSRGWRRRGLEADLGVGIDQGYATLGTFGFEGKRDYGAVGSVVHVASGLCDDAIGGQILASQRIVADLQDAEGTRSLGERPVEGLLRPVHVYEVVQLRTENGVRHRDGEPSGLLSAREREVVALIGKGYSNRQIAEALIIAESTAVRHVANILNKLDLRSRAQVAVWAVTRNQQSA